MIPTFSSKFRVADHVRVAETRPHWESNLRCGQEAIVIGSYSAGYSLMFPDGDRCSWFFDRDLTLIARNQWELAAEWEMRPESRIVPEPVGKWVGGHWVVDPCWTGAK